MQSRNVPVLEALAVRRKVVSTLIAAFVVVATPVFSLPPNSPEPTKTGALALCAAVFQIELEQSKAELSSPNSDSDLRKLTKMARKYFKKGMKYFEKELRKEMSRTEASDAVSDAHREIRSALATQVYEDNPSSDSTRQLRQSMFDIWYSDYCAAQLPYSG